MKICFPLLLVALLVCLASPALAKLKVGDKAPDFNGRTLENQPVKFSDFTGKILLVEMGTTWCPSCLEQAEQIDKLRDYLTESGVTYISVYLADSAENIRTHTAEHNFRPADSTIIDAGEARRNYGIFTIPRLLLIDKNGAIVFDESVLNSRELKRRIDNHRQKE